MGIKDDITLLGIKLRGWKWEIEDKLNDQRDAMVRRITTDPYIEGKKSGYEKAADEYKSVYEALKRQYKQAEKLLITQIQEKDNNLVNLVNELKRYEKMEEKYKRRLNEILQQLSTVSEKASYIDESKIQASLGGNLIYIIKPLYEKKFDKAEREGYEEAKEAYQKKISKLKRDLKKLIKKSEQELAKHDELISKTILCINEKLSSIAKLRMQIAEIKLLS